MDELEELLTNPVFQNLLGKAETHEWEFRPKEAESLEAEGKLQGLLIERTKACWDELRSCRRSGMTIWEAKEVALPLILVPDENEDPAEEECAGQKSGMAELNLCLGEPESPDQQGIERLNHCDGKALF